MRTFERRRPPCRSAYFRVATRPRIAGFTLIELLIVILIIGIIVAFILIAAQDGIRRAQDTATRGLIIKLEAALNDRIQSILTTTVEANGAHNAIAAIYPGNGITLPLVPANSYPYTIPYSQRSQVIAQFDRIKAEFPDVFLVQNDPHYPINYAATPYQSGATTSIPPQPYASYILPIGSAIPVESGGAWHDNATLDPLYNPNYNLLGTGIMGASYTVAAGINQQLGYGSQGYDGLDNNQDGLVDDLIEGTAGLSASQIAQIQTNLQNHTHNTARSEILYAILIYGQGPFGSQLQADDFTDKEVQDTDHDGLMEFVDAWGKPLLFFRWPIFHPSDYQLGWRPYSSTQAFSPGAVGNVMIGSLQPREQDPLDPNQQIVSPMWWSSQVNSGNTFSFSPDPAGVLSPNAYTFQSFFHLIVEPNLLTTVLSGSHTPPDSTLWDRGHIYPARRAFFTKFLILSGGSDTVPGVGQLATSYPVLNGNISDGSGQPMPITVPNLIYIENQAGAFDPSARSGPYMLPSSVTQTTTYLQNVFSGDDISNQPVTQLLGVNPLSVGAP